MMRRVLGALAVCALGSAALAGCAGGPFGGGGTCVDWVTFSTPADALEDASYAVIGTIAGQDGTADLYSYEVNAWTVQVDQWVKGAGDDELRVLSAPETCSEGSPYPTGDPFGAASGPQLILLTDMDGTWTSITPWQGVVAAPGGAVPEAWPPGTMGSPEAEG
ncbi:hypothetical protein [Microbacterium sp. KR10-403]|uniref:hypothetical protein n=1 Tax=Microbacterium sp. KR10-403 TaxID=3158581 RepID=UPI0032E37BC7